MEQDFNWFLDNYFYLYSLYGTGYFSIKNKTVLGFYDSFKEALEKTLENNTIGSFIIQFCNGEESGYTQYIY